LPNRHPFGYEGTEQKIREMYGLGDLGLIKGPPGSGKGTFMREIADHPMFEGHERINYMCSGTLEARDGIIWPGLGIGYIDSTSPHLVNPMHPSERVIDLHANVIPGKAPTQEQLNDIIKRRLEYYAESMRLLTLALKSKPTSKPDMKEVRHWFNHYDKMFKEFGVKPSGQSVVGFKKAVTSDGIVDYADTWAEPTNIEHLPCSEETAHEVFKLLHHKYGDHAFLHFMEPEKMLEGVHIGGILIRQHAGFEKKMDPEPLGKAITNLAGADKIMHQEIEGLYSGAVDYKKNDSLIKAELDRHAETLGR